MVCAVLAMHNAYQVLILPQVSEEHTSTAGRSTVHVSGQTCQNQGPLAQHDCCTVTPNPPFVAVYLAPFIGLVGLCLPVGEEDLTS